VSSPTPEIPNSIFSNWRARGDMGVVVDWARTGAEAEIARTKRAPQIEIRRDAFVM
jgi:hypothetical protein